MNEIRSPVNGAATSLPDARLIENYELHILSRVVPCLASPRLSYTVDLSIPSTYTDGSTVYSLQYGPHSCLGSRWPYLFNICQPHVIVNTVVCFVKKMYSHHVGHVAFHWISSFVWIFIALAWTNYFFLEIKSCVLVGFASHPLVSCSSPLLLCLVWNTLTRRFSLKNSLVHSFVDCFLSHFPPLY